MTPPTSGPTTLHTAKVPAKRPWYFDRSRGSSRSPIVVCDRVMRPPAPIPWRPRNTMSWVIVPAAPHSIEPMRKTEIETMKSGLRPYMSLSLP